MAKKKIPKEVVPKEVVSSVERGCHTVYRGTQPVLVSDSLEECEACRDRLIDEARQSGADISQSEHRIEIRSC